MKPVKRNNVRHLKRKRRVRGRIFGTAERPRLTVSRSNRQISAQLIDDLSGKTLCSAATHGKAMPSGLKHGGNCEAATKVGQAIAEKARMQNIKEVSFDRNGCRYHGRVKALAEAARKAGLVF